MRRTFVYLTLALCSGGLAITLADGCDNSPPSNTTMDMSTQQPQPDMTVIAPAPSVTSLSVVKGPTTGGTMVTLTGTNFVQGATVTFGGKAATAVTVSADGLTITATTPPSAGMPGDVDVVVNNNNGTPSATLIKGFRYFLGTTSFMAPGANPTVMGLGNLGPRSLSTLDLTGQGSASLVTANGNGNNISVIANIGTPPALMFATPVPVPTGQNYAFSAATADLTGDGQTDVIVANQMSNSLTAVIRQGQNATPNTIATAVGTFSGPRFVAAADFDLDNKQDVVVTNGNSTISLIKNSGNGTTFTSFAGAPVTIGGGFDAYGVAVGDFDGDMRPDVAIGNNAAASNTIRILLNKAAGFQLQNATPIPGAVQPNAIAAADFDGDRKIDLAVANRGSSNVGILKGDGAGAFTLMGTLTAVGTGPEAIAVGDLNLDGFIDIVVPSFTSNDLHYLLGKGNGTFDTPVRIALTAASGPNAVSIADFNKDGRPDIAVTRFNTGGVDVLLGTGQ
jgi:hypothetical protein